MRTSAMTRHGAEGGDIRRQRELGRVPRLQGTPDEAPDGCAPWFERPRRSAGRGNTIVFGHWASLGLYRQDGVVCLDSGAAWGRALSAIRLDDGALVQQQTVD